MAEAKTSTESNQTVRVQVISAAVSIARGPSNYCGHKLCFVREIAQRQIIKGLTAEVSANGTRSQGHWAASDKDGG